MVIHTILDTGNIEMGPGQTLEAKSFLRVPDTPHEKEWLYHLGRDKSSRLGINQDLLL